MLTSPSQPSKSQPDVSQPDMSPGRAPRFGAWPGGWRDSVTTRSAAVGAGLVSAFIALRLIVTHGASGFVVAGTNFATPSSGLRIFHGGGYDGQFVYRLAHDPFTHTPTAFGISFDNVSYRQQRIATSFLAHLVDMVPGISTAWAVLIVNALALVLAGVAATHLCADLGRSWRWAPLLAVPACMPVSLGRDLNEPVAWAAILVAILAVRRGRWVAVPAALTVAVLARETSLIVVFAFGLYGLYLLLRRRTEAWRYLAAVTVPLVVEATWQIHLSHVWGGRIPLLQGTGNNTSAGPFLGVAQSFFNGFGDPGLKAKGLAAVYLVDRLVLLALLIAVAVQVGRRRQPLWSAETIAWGGAALLALSLHDWARDVQFLRAAYESWGLSVLILLGARGRAVNAVLLGAGLVTVGTMALYVTRV